MTKTHMDSQTFVGNVRLSGLIPEEELDAALERVPPTERGRSVARALVQLGLLTKFQAQLLLVGRTHGFFLGQYRILDQLGEGGMGRVFKAEHMTMGRTVAIKVLAPQHTKTEKARQLFMREVRASGKLMHPNIVTAHDANEMDGRHYLVMEFIDGPNLDQLVRERGPLPVGLACDIVRQAASGLQCAFEHSMVHRDIKPSNLLLQRIGTTLSSGYLVKILDFGLARLGDAAEVAMGTPDYLSPEQARDLHLVDIRSDLYSLGCTFYFLLTGQVPFPGGTTVEKLTRHTKDEPLGVEQLRPDLPPEVADVVHCLLAKGPVNRCQTPAELVMELVPHAAPMPSTWANSRQTPSASADTVHHQTNTNGLGLDLEDKIMVGPPDKSALAVNLPDDLLPGALSTTDVRLLPPGHRTRASQWTFMATSAAVGLTLGALGSALALWLLQ
jgi:serine/threonine protein kinase